MSVTWMRCVMAGTVGPSVLPDAGSSSRRSHRGTATRRTMSLSTAPAAAVSTAVARYSWPLRATCSTAASPCLLYTGSSRGAAVPVAASAAGADSGRDDGAEEDGDGVPKRSASTSLDDADALADALAGAVVPVVVPAVGRSPSTSSRLVGWTGACWVGAGCCGAGDWLLLLLLLLLSP